MKTVSAVVVTYNRLELLKECLQALFVQSYSLQHIIVIDNHSDQATQDYLTQLGTKIDYVRLDENIGGAGGFYTGVKKFAEATTDDFVWLMDDDTIPESDALANLMHADAIVPQAGFLASNPKWIDGSPAIMNVPVVAHPMWTEQLNRENHLVAISRASFVSVLVARTAVLQVGLPIQQFFIWGDDTEYTERIRRDFSGYFVPESIVIHKMKQNQDVDIIQDSPDRIKRYFYAYRNRLYNARQRSHKEVLRYWFQFITTFNKLLFRGGTGRFKKIGVLCHGAMAGLTFRPQVEFAEVKK
ncbi:glycosyltransferase family 2 protein [Loigolactobacillus zhaoyuanensis]|uniref:glycosyltransferase family 2 protein n=1 Tax=Loigolactobacillus zhaoyuanensis TaxID=2486017 RepID=UPI000F742C86|nr:glycosyltransferase family 2 protein [Loigolactobacillus zhaoyuanensis]